LGAAPVESLMGAGVRVCVGDDGCAGGMAEEWRAAQLLHKFAARDPRRMSGHDTLEMAIRNAGALASEFFSKTSIGRIVPGAAADLVLVDYSAPTPVTAENVADHLTRGMVSGMVTTTIAAGKVLMKDRRLLTLDEDSIKARARDLAPRIWKRYAEQVGR
jgi:cytosine/adenosine deaminase-related metal-dependent hydrolase